MRHTYVIVYGAWIGVNHLSVCYFSHILKVIFGVS